MLRLFVLLVSFAITSCSSAPKSPPASSGVPLVATSAMGLHLRLKDRSNWTVQPIGQGSSLYWQPGDPIRVLRYNHPSFPYMLINERAGNSTPARFMGQS